MIDYTTKDFAKGQRVEMHPATDLWMRGARYGTVTHVSKAHVNVKLDKLDFIVHVAARNLLPIVPIYSH